MDSSNSRYSLIDEEWIPVLDAGGHRRDVSLTGLFEHASDLRVIACESPTQTFAILRLALAVLHSAIDGPESEQHWQALWRSPALPSADVTGYLADYRDRFDLLHPTHPFYQVADLTTGREPDFGLERLIADAPAGVQFLTNRAGPGMSSISPAEAARWLIHCQAYDTAGIKTGAQGDPRVKGGRGYPMGVAPLGMLGGVYLEGTDLRETLLLNLLPLDSGWIEATDADRPVWENDPLTAAEQPETTRGPYGPRSLYTWPARRIRLFGDPSGITGAMVSYGDRLDLQDAHHREPMSVWKRSPAREKELKRAPVYMPRPFFHTRALWRGLQTILPPPVSSTQPTEWMAPLVTQWLARLTRNRIVEPTRQVRPRAVSITYGTKGAVIDEIFSDALTMNVQVLVPESPLSTTAIDAAADADKAVGRLRTLAANLVRAAGGTADGSGDLDRATERGYALLDRAFRDWLSHLQPDSDPATTRAEWQRLVKRGISRIGSDLVANAGPAAWAGRTITDRNGRETYYSSAQADAWFRSGLARDLPMANQNEEAPA